MSTSGSATVVVVPAALLAAPFVVLAGGVVLVAEGAIWCGKQLRARYEAKCNSWTEGTANVIDASRMDAQSLSSLLSAADSRYQAILAGMPPQQRPASGADQAVVQRAYQEALDVIQLHANAQRTSSAAQPGENAELQRLRGDLAVETAIAERAGIDVARAKRALHVGAKTEDEAKAIREALQELKGAWAREHDTTRQRNAQFDRADLMLHAILGKVQNLRSVASGMTPAQNTKLGGILARIDTAQGRLKTDPKAALADAQMAQGEFDELERAVLASVPAPGSARSGDRAARLRGRVSALQTLVAEALQLQNPVFTDAVSARFTRQLASVQQQLQQPDERQLAALAQTVDALEHEVFNAVDSMEQHAIGDKIADAMRGQGFGANDSAAAMPLVEQLADGGFRVQGIRNDARASEDPQEKVVTFHLLPDGRISYDFAGYVGVDCKKDADAIFRALRAHGIIIVDERWQRDHAGIASFTEAQASAPIPSVDPEHIRKQAAIASGVIQALHRMGYSDDEVKVSSSGPEVHITAQRDGLGYYNVDIDRDGDTTREHGGASHLPNPLQPIDAVVSQVDEQNVRYVLEESGEEDTSAAIQQMPRIQH